MRAYLSLFTLAVAGLVGCTSNLAPSVAGKIRDSMKQAGLKDVTVSQDRNKGVVTLGGNVATMDQKAQADQIAQPIAGGQVVANEIAVVPNGDTAVKTVYSDFDKGIEANLDAVLTQSNIKGVTHSTKQGVVTLKGDLPTPPLRAEAERIAVGVPNVQQVVNEISVKNQRATSSAADRSANPDKR
ncbi:MAG: BON domain-containing protein [Bryobacteraceae bacterium]|jgi:hyperosmotically inducible periplasmic protein